MSGKDFLGDLDGSEIAIIGLSGRFPKARNIEEFWLNLREGVEGITFFSDSELIQEGIDPKVLSDPTYVKAHGMLEDIDLFDASFFGYSPREAEIIDPQQRFFLECAWEALEDAGYNPETYSKQIGVYVGANNIPTYMFHNVVPSRETVETVGLQQITFGNSGDYLPTRVSYKLNLQGPSYLIQSACSTSLVAVHVACEAIRNGECNIALAGGVSIISRQKAGYFYRPGNINSPDGHCRAFDEKARGTVGGCGLSIVVLKNLSDALADDDNLYSIIRGSAINNDGSRKIGFTAPSVDGQAEVIAEAHSLARVDPETITYVETHGTGTELGDPIEIMALTKAFRLKTDKKGFCAIGSVKTNVGHLDAAAGVTGLIKTVLALKHKVLPPSLHFERPNPKIDFANSPFYVCTSARQWESDESPRRAGVSSFGVGGTNAHLVLEEAPKVEESDPPKHSQLLTLSAMTNSALEVASLKLARHLDQHPDINLADVAFTLHVGRKVFSCRRYVVCNRPDQAVEMLEKIDPRQISFCEDENRLVTMMFPGQGAQYVNMAAELYRSNNLFRNHLDVCFEILEPCLGLNLRSIVFPSEHQAERASQQINLTFFAQPILFAIEYALARLLIKWGIRPNAMIGHSLGEFIAACLAGVFSLEEALAIVAARGQLMQRLEAGGMLAVTLAEQDVLELMGDELSLAAINGPTNCVVSGSFSEIAELEQRLVANGVSFSRLRTSHAFHSKMMDPIITAFVDRVKRVSLKPPRLPYISNVTATWISADEATDPAYWGRHLRETVRFGSGLSELMKDERRVLLEVGPGQALSALARQSLRANNERVVSHCMRHPDEQRPDFDVLLDAVGKLWSAGVKVNWGAFHDGQKQRRVSLPRYPFERQRYWIDRRNNISNAALEQISLRKITDITDWFFIPSWKRSKPLNSLASVEIAEPHFAWLLFVDECGLGLEIAKQLRSEGLPVVTVARGDQFTGTPERGYAINPTVADDYHKLIKELYGLNLAPRQIIHLWTVTSVGRGETEFDDVNDIQNAGFYSLIYLAQALGEHAVDAPIKIAAVTTGLHDVIGDEPLCPQKALILGPCKVIPQEYSNILSRSIDIVLPAPGSPPASETAKAIIGEFSITAPESVVCYRGNHRWVQSFEGMRLRPPSSGVSKLREQGAYLITGGLGGIGLALAEHIANQVKAKLALVGRNGLPPKHAWERWLEDHDPDDHVSAKIRKIQSLERSGADVLVLSADVANLDQMEAAVNRAVETFGEITGVIHAAGIAGGGPVQLKTQASSERVLAPKVKGTIVLSEVLKRMALDFFISCSSVNAIVARMGQVDYCAANAFLDAFSHYLSRKKIPSVSINWPGWQEVGMLVETASPQRIRKPGDADLRGDLLTREGAEAFNRLISAEALPPQVIVSIHDIGALAARNDLRAISKKESNQAAGRKPVSTYSRPMMATNFVEPSNERERALTEIWQEILGIDRIGVQDNFFELGGHSLLAIRLLSRLKEVFNQEIPLRTVFDAPTISGFCEILSEKQTAQRIEPDSTRQIKSRSNKTIDQLLLELE